jgi:hypothetical protein
VLAALLSAAPANAELTSTAAPPTSVAADETATPVEVDLAPAGPPQADSAPTETSASDIPPEAAVAEKAASVATEVVSSVDDPSLTQHAKDATSSDPSASEAVSVPVDSTSPAQPDALVGSSVEKVGSSVEKLQENALPQRHVPTAVAQAGRNFKAAVETVGRDSAGAIAAATERLTSPVVELDLLAPLFDSISPLSLTPLMAEEAQFLGAAQAGAAPKGTARIEGPSQLRQHAGLLASTTAIDPRLSLGEHLADASILGIANAPGSEPRHLEMGLSPSIAAAETAYAGPSDERSGNPARPDLPPPVPQSPATAVGSSGGSSFVPVVALLALLALVAPTARRRLGEVADFRAPTPFVCALERPG